MIKTNNKGFTLVEITLVLGLTLGLAAALIFGLSAYQQGADRAKCLLTQANVQKAVRSYQNLNELNPGDACTGPGTLWPNVASDTNCFLSAPPMCPRASGGAGNGNVGANGGRAYGPAIGMTALVTVPPVGTAYISCSTVPKGSGTYQHYPKTIDGVLAP